MFRYFFKSLFNNKRALRCGIWRGGLALWQHAVIIERAEVEVVHLHGREAVCPRQIGALDLFHLAGVLSIKGVIALTPRSATTYDAASTKNSIERGNAWRNQPPSR